MVVAIAMAFSLTPALSRKRARGTQCRRATFTLGLVEGLLVQTAAGEQRICSAEAAPTAGTNVGVRLLIQKTAVELTVSRFSDPLPLIPSPSPAGRRE
jgi:hypothetical protein